MTHTDFIENSIVPKQPYFVMTTSHYYKAVYMQNGICHFYSFAPEGSDTSLVVPDGCVDMVFRCSRENPYAYVCSTCFQTEPISFETGYRYFGVRFFPGQSPLFTKISPKELVEHGETPFLDLINDTDVFQQITCCDDFHRQIEIFLKFYLVRYVCSQEMEKNSILNHYLINRIIHASGNIRIRDLAEDTGYSERYINKVFIDAMGFTPKAFCKFMRFQHILTDLNEYQDHADLAGLACCLGYYDQSHMIQDFHKLIDTTPKKYIHSLQKADYENRIILV